MAHPQHGRAWRVGQYLGLVSDEPGAKAGSREWWRNLSFTVVCVVVALLVVLWLV